MTHSPSTQDAYRTSDILIVPTQGFAVDIVRHEGTPQMETLHFNRATAPQRLRAYVAGALGVPHDEAQALIDSCVRSAIEDDRRLAARYDDADPLTDED